MHTDLWQVAEKSLIVPLISFSAYILDVKRQKAPSWNKQGVQVFSSKSHDF